MIEVALVQALVQALMGLFPGIPAGISSFLASLTNQLPALVASGTDVVSFVRAQMVVVQKMVDEKRDPTFDEWNTLNTAMRNELANLNIKGMHPNAPGMA